MQPPATSGHSWTAEHEAVPLKHRGCFHTKVQSRINLVGWMVRWGGVGGGPLHYSDSPSPLIWGIGDWELGTGLVYCQFVHIDQAYC